MFFVAVVAIASVSTSICQMNKAARLTSAQDPTEIGRRMVNKLNVTPLQVLQVKW